MAANDWAGRHSAMRICKPLRDVANVDIHEVLSIEKVDNWMREFGAANGLFVYSRLSTICGMCFRDDLDVQEDF